MEKKMNYRQLTRDEIIQLGQELDDLRRWEGARDYVSALYGLGSSHSSPEHRPHQITISIVSEFKRGSDFSRGYGEDVNIIVTDSQNHPVPYDFTRYWWSQFTLDEKAKRESLQDTSGKLEHVAHLGDESLLNALEDLCTEKLGIEFLAHAQRHDPITYTYLIDTPPSVSFPAVYVPE
jgi:hypothetical protein